MIITLTEDEFAGNIIIYKTDADYHTFVSVVQMDALRYDVRGWIRAADAKRAEFRREPPDVRDPCYWVPALVLRTDAPAVHA